MQSAESDESEEDETTDDDEDENEDFPEYKVNGYHPMHIG